MKKSLVTLLLCASALMAQPSKVAMSGANIYILQPVKFGGNNDLTLTTGKDTLSDPIVIESGTIRPGQVIALEYFAIASDSGNSSYRIDFQSRTCQTPATSSGCPSRWLVPRFRRIYNTSHFADTVTVALLPSDTTAVSHATMLPTGNQLRIRVRATGATSNYFRDLYIRGF